MRSSRTAGRSLTTRFLCRGAGTTLQVDLGADKLIAAEKAERKIAVEIKSFLSRSLVEDLEDALGQIVQYRYVLGREQPRRELYLAVRREVYLSYLAQPHVMDFLRSEKVRLLAFNPQTEEVEQWISWSDTETSLSES
jgi:hypothetical protein